MELVDAYEKNETITGKITSKCKGGVIVEHIDTGSLMFCPGSQISDKPMKDISHLMHEPQKFALIKIDKMTLILIKNTFFIKFFVNFKLFIM